MSKDKKPEARPDEKRDDSFYRLAEWPGKGSTRLWTVERHTATGRRERLRIPDTRAMMEAKLASCVAGLPPEPKFWEEVKT